MVAITSNIKETITSIQAFAALNAWTFCETLIQSLEFGRLNPPSPEAQTALEFSYSKFHIPFAVYGLICHSQAGNNNVWGNNKGSFCVCLAYQRVFIRKKEVTHTTTHNPPSQTLGKPIEPATRTSNFEHVAKRCRLKRHGKSLFFSRFLTVNSAGCGRASGRVRVLRWIRRIAFLFLFHSSHLRQGVCVCQCACARLTVCVIRYETKQQQHKSQSAVKLLSMCEIIYANG